MEDWTKIWLEEQRQQGKRCLEIKLIKNNYYVYNSTTRWDKDAKKTKKISKYLGKLDKTKGLILANKQKNITSADIRTIKEYGNSMLLHKAIEPLKSVIKEAFPNCWEEIYSLAMVRVNGYMPIKRANDSWDKLYNKEHINPKLNPKNISKTLHQIGMNRDGQNLIFKQLTDQSNQLIYDLSSMFSHSMNIGQAEKGYNKDHLQIPQINIALMCSIDTGMPTMVRTIPGSVKDIKTLYTSIKEVGVKGKIMVLDRGFFSDEIMDFLETIQMSYVLPVRRNSKYYENRIHCNNHLIYHKRLIRSGKRKLDKSVAYVFEDMDLKLEEQKTLNLKLEDAKITKKQIDEKMKSSWMILILSNLDIEPKEIFYLFKKRENIEKMFDTYKTVLNADKLYLQDDESVFGHIFISFLSLYIHCAIEKMLKIAKLNHKITPIDLLQKFGKVYNLKVEDKNIITEVPKKVKELDELLELNIFPKVQS